MALSPLHKGIVTGLSVVLVGGLVYVGFVMTRPKDGPSLYASAEARSVEAERHVGDAKARTNPKVAEEKYREVIRKNASSPNIEVQEEVGQARMRLAFIRANKRDFKTARTMFLEANREHKGAQSMSADFGGLRDQAAYQAIAGLSGMGKKDEAIKELEQFMVDYKLSPLVHAAHKRLDGLQGHTTEKQDQLLQAAIEAQEKRVRFEMSVCGPKVICQILKQLDGKDRDYKEVARLCSTKDTGTTVEGMREGLKALGYTTFALDLNAEDIRKLPVPSILLTGDHYVSVVKVSGDSLTVFDTLSNARQELKLPDRADTQSRFAVITFSLPNLGSQP